MSHLRISRQEGVVLVITLFVLVAMSITAVILFRKVDIATLIAGNIAFKQGTTLAADRGVETARAWLNANTGLTLESNQSAGGYFASYPYNSNPALQIDFHGRDSNTSNDFDWSTAATVTPDLNDPYTIDYVIHRLCDAPGKPTSVACQRSAIGGADLSTRGTPSYGGYAIAAATQVYYQVTVRVRGPRNTSSFVQAILN